MTPVVPDKATRLITPPPSDQSRQDPTTHSRFALISPANKSVSSIHSIIWHSLVPLPQATHVLTRDHSGFPPFTSAMCHAMIVIARPCMTFALLQKRCD